MTPVREHPGPAELIDLLDGRETAWVRDHAASCLRCGGELERLRETRALARELVDVPEPPVAFWADFGANLEARLDEPGRRSWLPWLAAAAVLLAALGLVSEAPRVIPAARVEEQPLETDATRLAILEALEPSQDEVAPWGRCPDGACLVDLSDDEALVLAGLLRAEMKEKGVEL